MRKVLLIGVACTVLFVAPSWAQSGLSGENLVLEIPSGYELGYHQEAVEGKINEFIPKGETVEKWSEMVTVMLLPPENDNAKYYAALESFADRACKGLFSHVVATTEENGYSIKVFQLFCPTNLQTNMGEITFVKTFEGKDKFYVVQKAWRTKKYKIERIPLTGDENVKWLQYLRSVYVCDSRVKERKCP